MSLFYGCFFCLQSHNKANITHILCLNCKDKFADYKFYCCPRCSKFDCSGCEHLAEFYSIFCVYSYNSVISKIIVNAKDKFNYMFQEIFEEIFYESIKLEMEKILNHKHYSVVILSPYHKKRMFHGYWHPNIFFEKILQELKIKNDYTFEILNPHYTSAKSSDVYLSNHSQLMDNILTQTQGIQDYNVLLCDDVLTTGKSAITAFYAARKILYNKKELNSSVQPKWDLFTIFRSPQK